MSIQDWGSIGELIGALGLLITICFLVYELRLTIAAIAHGALSENLAEAVEQAMRMDRDYCRRFTIKHSWDSVTDVFESVLVAY